MKRGGQVKKKRGTSAAKEKARADKAWGAYIHARDKVCQYCGKADGKLDAHHIMIRSFSATRTDEACGVLLCFQHHQLMHSDAMAAFNFYLGRLGEEGYDVLRRKAYDGVGGKYPASWWISERLRLEALLAEVGQ